jgi:cation diffusion facilitator family transporter
MTLWHVQEVNMLSVRQQVNRVLWVTLFLNLAVAFGKIITGYVLGALAITADGFHSLADGTSNIVALIASTVAGTPPDEDHPYGHQRFETLAALGIGVLLFLTAWETIQGVMERLAGGEPPRLTPAAFIVMVFTLVVNIAVNRYQVWQGKKLKSEILLADAANTGADIFVTLSVIVSMGLMVAFGWNWTDIVAALLVVVLIARAAWQIIRRTGRVLVDTAPFTPEEITTLALQVPSVSGVTRARSRGSVDNAYIDIDVEVSAETTAERTAAVADAIETRIRDGLHGVAEVSVQFVPIEPEQPDYESLVQSSAIALGLRAHRVHVNHTRQGAVLEFHVEVMPGQTLNQAHEQVSQLEQSLGRRFPEMVDVVTHIEPATLPVNGIGHPDRSVDTLTHRVLTVLQSQFADVDWHDLRVYPQEEGFAMTIHATLPSDMSIEAAHHLAGEAERLLRSQISPLDRITIHTEPLEG